MRRGFSVQRCDARRVGDYRVSSLAGCCFFALYLLYILTLRYSDDSKQGGSISATVEVDEQTYRSLEFAARVSNITPSEVVARLVAAASTPAPALGEAAGPHSSEGVAVYADYEGHRTRAIYDRDTTRVDVTSGPLEGRSFKTPTGAARAVVAYYKPSVSPNRNGWWFWTLDDGSGRRLQVIRR
jgi:hypothetical protein